MDLGIEERKAAIEALATLVRVKHTMAELILKPAGIPPDIYQPLLYRRDPANGYVLSKRQIAPLIIEACDQRPECAGVVRRIVEIAAGWEAFHLSQEEFHARAAVQKARDLLGTIAVMEAREAAARDRARQEEVARLSRERAEFFEQRSMLLRTMFEDLSRSPDPQSRGYLLEILLNQLFDLHEIPVWQSFRRNGGAEQIDGAFKLDGWHYIIECRWREKVVDPAQVDALYAKVERVGKQTLGVFLSINGWSTHVLTTLKQNPSKSVILMHGGDLWAVLDRQADLRDLIFAKLARLNFHAEPFYGAHELSAAP